MNVQQSDIHAFLRRYFTFNGCELLNDETGCLQVKLTVELDKLLMNRPFYWQYLEATGGKPEPVTLTLVTDQTLASKYPNGELIHFGSPRLHQILQSARELGHSIRMYESLQPTGNRSEPLQPWLCQNVKISFQSDRKKELLLSLGLNLIHGQMSANFYDVLNSLPLAKKIPDYAFTLSPLITPKSGFLRLEKVIRHFVLAEDKAWAKEAMERWEDDLKLLDEFYEEYEEKPDSYHIEKEALQSQYEPKIFVETINGGIFYLRQGSVA